MRLMKQPARRMKMMKGLYFLCILSYQVFVIGFNQKYRILSYDLSNNVKLNRDALLSSTEDVLDEICKLQECNDQNVPVILDQLKIAEDEFIKSKLGAFYQNQSNIIQNPRNFEWLSLTYSELQQTVMEHLLEVENLRAGKVLPRESCNNYDRSKSPPCLYFRAATEYGIAYKELLPATLIEKASSNVFGLLTVIEYLFNVQWYDHSEALAVHTLYHIVPQFYFTFNGNETIQKELAEAAIRLSLVMKELETVRGNIEESTYWSLYNLRNIQDHHQSDGRMELLKRSALFQLRALIIIPVIPRNTIESVHFRKLMVDDLTKFAAFLERNQVTISLYELTGQISATPFHMSHQGLNDLDFQLAYNKVLLALCPELRVFHPTLPTTFTKTKKTNVNSLAPSVSLLELPQESVGSQSEIPIKIGFVSSHFFDHSIGRMFVQLMLLFGERLVYHSKEGDKEILPEIFVYFIDDKNTTDYITNILSTGLGDNFIRVPTNITIARNAIMKDNLDVLFFADLGMDFYSYAIAFSRVATYQIAWWGHPITSGLTTIDYFFSIEDEIVDADSHYSEQLVRMNFVNSMPMQRFVPDHSQRAELPQKAELPPDAKFVVILGRLFKFHPDFLEMIVDLLILISQQPTEVKENLFIVTFAEKIYDYNRDIIESLKGKIRARLPAESSGEDNVMTILRHFRLLSYAGYYHSLSPFARGMMDSYPYGGCVTTHDALHFGLPTVSLPSQYIRGRFTLGMYRQMEVMGLIAQDPGDYVRKVFRLLVDDDYQRTMAQLVQRGFDEKLNQNTMVAQEWMAFLIKLLLV